MTSMLAKQLEAHRANNPLPPPADAKKSRPTILFKDMPSKANNLDAKQILDIGRNGLQRLCAVDSDRFKKYQNTLFSSALGSDSKSERHLLPKSEKEEVDEQCKELLQELTPYLSFDFGKQVLEFLLQRYFVHISMPDTLLGAVLPYHQTELFADVVNLPSIGLTRSKWAFLTKLQLDSKGLPRSYLVEYSCKDVGLMDEICRVTAKGNSKFFAAFALECLERRSDSPGAPLDMCVSVLVRNSIDALKSEDPADIVAACCVIGTVARCVSLAEEASESLLILLAKRIGKLQAGVGDFVEEVRLDIAKCMIQVYEWQARTVELFKQSEERWSKFYKHVQSCVVDLQGAEALANVSSKLITMVACRSANEDDGKTICNLPWEGDVYHGRAMQVFQVVINKFERLAQTSSSSSSMEIGVVRKIVTCIATHQPKAFELILATLEKSKRKKFSAACFPDSSTSLAIRVVPFEDEANLAVAIRDGRPSVRRNALKHLEQNASKILPTLFSVEDDEEQQSSSIAAILLKNYMHTCSNGMDDPDLDELREEFEVIITLYGSTLKAGSVDEVKPTVRSSIHNLLREALCAPWASKDEPLYTLLVETICAIITSFGGKKNATSEEYLELAYALVPIASSSSSSVRAQINKALSSTWLAEVTEQKFAAIVRRMKSENPQEVRSRLFKFAQYSPQVAIPLAVEMLLSKFFAPHSSEWLLRLLEGSGSPVVAGGSTTTCPKPKDVAVELLSASESNSFESLVVRILQAPAQGWTMMSPILMEAFSLSPVEMVEKTLQKCCRVPVVSTNSSEQDVVVDRRIVRALRLLRAYYASSAGKRADHGDHNKKSAKKKANGSKQPGHEGEEQIQWICLLSAIKHPRMQLIRKEALNALEVLGSSASLCEILLPQRREELERDPAALIRAISKQSQLRSILEVHAQSSVKQLNFSDAYDCLDCVQDTLLGAKLLNQIFGEEKDAENGRSERQAVIDLCFKVLLQNDVHRLESSTVSEICLKGLSSVAARSSALKFMVKSWKLVPPANKEIFSMLLQIAEASGSAQSLSTINEESENIERAGKVLMNIHFPETFLIETMTQIQREISPPAAKPQALPKKFRLKESLEQQQQNNNTVSPSSPSILSRRICIIADIVGAEVRSWNVFVTLFDLLDAIRVDDDKGASKVSNVNLVEQTILSSIERTCHQFTRDQANESRHTELCKLLVREMNHATNASAKWTAIRAFRKCEPSFDSFDEAFRTITDCKALEDIADAVCSTSVRLPNKKIPASLIPTFCDAVFRLNPSSRLAMLRSFGGKCESPAALLFCWLRLSNSDSDCSAIGAQFNSLVQTELLIQLVNTQTESSIQEIVVSFVAKHLSSRGYMKSLVENEDSDISLFIELFESLLRQLFHMREITEDEKSEQIEQAERIYAMLEKALDNLSVLLSVPVFIPVVSEILLKQEPEIRLLALRVLKNKIRDEFSDWSKEETRFVVEFAQTLISWLEKGDTNDVTHTTILALNALAMYLGGKHKDIFVKCLPKLAEVVSRDEENSIAMRSAACLCMGTITRNVGTHTIPYLQVVIPSLLQACSITSDNDEREEVGTVDREEEVLEQASLACLKDFFEAKVPLGQVFTNEIIMNVVLNRDEGAKSNSSRSELLECIGENLEPRLGLQCCMHAFKAKVNYSQSCQLLDMIVSRTSVQDAVTHLNDLKQLCVECLLGSSAVTINLFDANVIVKIGLLMSEKKLKEIVDVMVAAVEEDSLLQVRDALMETLRAFAEKCGALFLPLVPFDFVVNSLRSCVVQVQGASSGDDRIQAKKKQKMTSSIPLLETSSLSLEVTLRGVSECLVHAIGTGFIDATRFEELLQPLVETLQVMPVQFSQKFVEPVFASMAYCVLSSSQANAYLQNMHHSVTKLLRSSSPQIRQAALSCVKTLFERIGNDYLALLPDTLPFLAELLEDSVEPIRILAQKTALVLRDLSGEDISEFLK